MRTFPTKMELDRKQKIAASKLRSGSILLGGVGSGKSRTALYYFFRYVCDGRIPINGAGDYRKPKVSIPLIIITTAKKRDSLEWGTELARVRLTAVVDSWNNIGKYRDVKDSFFIFDEQRVIGSGTWVKLFLAITKHNQWILLTATPGDTWSDYIPVFIANGFYKNRTAFLTEHAVYSKFTLYPKIERYINCNKLLDFKRQIIVDMGYASDKDYENHYIDCDYLAEDYNIVSKQRWNVFTQEPILDAGALCFCLRKVVNSHFDRIYKVCKIYNKHKKVIVFYNFNYELVLLREAFKDEVYAEWNGNVHESIPQGDRWLYFVQYTSGAEGWNCIETNVIIFYSLNYSFRIMRQAAGRIDRRNSPYDTMIYYYLLSDSSIDDAILACLKRKGQFNENEFFNSQKKQRLL